MWVDNESIDDVLNYGGHVKPLYTRCASAKGVLVPYIDRQ
jgi:hypothetical protein